MRPGLENTPGQVVVAASCMPQLQPTACRNCGQLHAATAAHHPVIGSYVCKHMCFASPYPVQACTAMYYFSATFASVPFPKSSHVKLMRLSSHDPPRCNEGFTHGSTVHFLSICYPLYLLGLSSVPSPIYASKYGSSRRIPACTTFLCFSCRAKD